MESENRFTGWVDVPLSAKGEQEAREAGNKVQHFHFDHAFTSGLIRAQETLRIALEVIGQTEIAIERNQALNERMYGELQGLNKMETSRKVWSAPGEALASELRHPSSWRREFKGYG